MREGVSWDHISSSGPRGRSTLPRRTRRRSRRNERQLSAFAIWEDLSTLVPTLVSGDAASCVSAEGIVTGDMARVMGLRAEGR